MSRHSSSLSRIRLVRHYLKPSSELADGRTICRLESGSGWLLGQPSCAQKLGVHA